MSDRSQSRQERTVLSYNRSVGLSGSVQRLSSDAGALLVRQLDERLGFTKALATRLVDPRSPVAIEFSLAELIRSRTYTMVQGWHDQSDADRLRQDPAFCVATSDSRGPGAADRGLASQSTQSRLIDTLSLLPNRSTMRSALPDLAIRCQQLRSGKPLESFTIDLDSTNQETHGSQQGSKYNGYYEQTCYHPLLAFAGETGDLLGGWLRPGNVSSQRGASVFALRLMQELVGKYGDRVKAVRGDCAFATPLIMNCLDDHETPFVFRLRWNKALERLAEPYMKRPVGRPPDHVREWTYDLEYQADGWRAPRRMVLVVIDDPKDRFMDQPGTGLRSFCLVTNFTAKEMPGEKLLEYYRQRGTVETRIGEFKNEIQPLLSSPRLVENATTFLLGAIAYQLAHTLRLMATNAVGRTEWYSLSAFREQLLKVAARFTSGQNRVYAAVASTAWAIWQRIFARLAPA
jgi:hypothetical protein